MLGCVMDNIDISNCCSNEGVPMDLCGDICRGQGQKLDYRHFKWDSS